MRRLVLALVLVVSVIGGCDGANGGQVTPDTRIYCTGLLNATLAPNCRYGPQPT